MPLSRANQPPRDNRGSNQGLLSTPSSFVFNPKATSDMARALTKKLPYHLLGKLLSQALDLQLGEIPPLFLERFWHGRNLLLLSGDSKRAEFTQRTARRPSRSVLSPLGHGTELLSLIPNTCIIFHGSDVPRREVADFRAPLCQQSPSPLDTAVTTLTNVRLTHDQPRPPPKPSPAKGTERTDGHCYETLNPRLSPRA